MKNNTFHYSWQNYTRDTVLLEARLKDIKARYPVWNDSGWLTTAKETINSTMGPKGVSKYLLFWVREMENNFKFEAGESEPEDESAEDIGEVGRAILDIITDFHENQQRLEEKDIYKYNAEDLRQAMEALGLTSKEKREKKKEEAMEGSEIVYDEEDIIAVRPYTAEASCYYGKNTRWCISAVASRNYFAQYAQDGASFIMLRLKNLKQSHAWHRIALVYNRDGDHDESYDATDERISMDEIKNAMACNYRPQDCAGEYASLSEEERVHVDNIISEIFEAAEDNVLNNAPDPTASYESRIRELEDEYSSFIKHAWYSADVDEYMYFNGGFELSIDAERLEGAEYSFPDTWQERSQVADALRGLLDTELGVYAEEVDIELHTVSDPAIAAARTERGVRSGEINVRVSIHTGDYDANPDGYESFLDELSGMDDKYPEMQRLVERYLMEEGYIRTGAFEKFSDELEDFGLSLNHFTYREEKGIGDEEIFFESPHTEYPIEMGLKSGATIRRIQDAQRIPLRQVWRSEKYTDMVISKLGDLHQKIVQYLEKQLELPFTDLPPKIIKRLTIPEFLEVNLYDNAAANAGRIAAFMDSEELSYSINISIQDVSVSQAAIDAAKEVIEFMDANWLKVERAAIQSMDALMREVRGAEDSRMATLDDSTVRLLRISQSLQAQSSRATIADMQDVVRSWKEGQASDEAMLEAVHKLYNYLKELGEIPEDLPPPQSSSLQEASTDEEITLQEINSYFINLSEKSQISDTIPRIKSSIKVPCASDVNEEIEKYLSSNSETVDFKDSKIKNREYDIRDLMDPDYNPWEVKDDVD